MTDFDALLKRSFAEAHEPADDGFVVNVGHAVAKREAGLKVRGYMQYGAMTIGAAAVSWGLYAFAWRVRPRIHGVARPRSGPRARRCQHRAGCRRRGAELHAVDGRWA